MFSHNFNTLFRFRAGYESFAIASVMFASNGSLNSKC